MAFVTVPEVSTGDHWSAKDINQYFRDNFAAGIPDIFTAKGDIVSASAADAGVILSVGANGSILAADSSASGGLAWRDFGAAASAYSISTTSLGVGTNGVDTPARYFTELTDPLSAQFVTTTTDYSFTVPSGYDGYYLIHFQMSSGGGAGEGYAVNEGWKVKIYVNGAAVSTCGQWISQVSSSDNMQTFTAGSDILHLAAGDVVKVYINVTWSLGASAHAYPDVTYDLPIYAFISYLGG